MRTLIELLELVKEEITLPRDYTGLCKVIGEMYIKDQITLAEQEKLQFCFIKNRPFSYHTYYPYYFPKGDMEIRKKYLEEIIERIRLVETK